MPEVARKGDTVSTGHACDGSSTLNTPTSNSTVYAGGELIACLGDLTVPHNILVGDSCVPHTAPISGASGSVFIGGIAVARKGDACDAGSITSGAASVIVG
jgi:uncharacterized Zn-binding protein involved in type VI secretion